MSLLGMATEADTDMTSYDFEFSAPIASDAMGEDFDIDLTYDDQAEHPDAVMVDSDENNDHLETQMADHDHFTDEPMFENLEQSAPFEFIETEDLDITTSKATSPEKLDVLTSTDEISIEPNSTAEVQKSINLDTTYEESKNDLENVVEDETAEHGAETEHVAGDFGEGYEDGEHPVEGLFDGTGVDEASKVIDAYDGDGVDDETAEEQDKLLQEFEQEDQDEEDTGYDPDAVDSAAPNPDTLDASDNEQGPNAGPLKYRAKVSWNGYWVTLFPDPLIVSATAFSEDFSLVEKDLTTFFKTGRQVLKASIPDDHILEMKIPQLDLQIDENSDECNDGSLMQILELYYKLHANDGVEDPEPMEIVFSSCLRYSARIEQLFEAAEMSKGYAELLGSTLDDLENEEETTPEDVANEEGVNAKGLEAHADDEEHEDQVADELHEGHEDEEEYEDHEDGGDYKEHQDELNHGDEEYEANGADDNHSLQNHPQEDLHEQVDEENHEETLGEDEYEGNEDAFAVQEEPHQVTDSSIDNGQTAIDQPAAVSVNTDLGKEISQSSPVTSSPSKPAPALDEKDEIDYTDTEDNVRTKTPKSSKVKKTLTSGKALSTTENDGEHDFEIDIYGHDQVDNPIGQEEIDESLDQAIEKPGTTPSLDTRPNTTTESVSVATKTALDNDAEFELELERSFSEDGVAPLGDQKPAGLTRTVTEKEEEIDWDEDEDEAPEAGVDSGPKGGSPLGKRNREDHLEGLAEVDDGQEAKRVRS